MTKREREQVVELLRCAADLAQRGEGLLLQATARLDHDFMGRVFGIASDAWVGPWMTTAADHYTLLEAAARVEEGSWP